MGPVGHGYWLLEGLETASESQSHTMGLCVLHTAMEHATTMRLHVEV